MIERETPLGKARRIHQAHLRTAWEHNYRDPINDARKGNVQRLIDCLMARKPLEDDDYDLLAGFIRDNFRKPGNQFEELPRKVALLALTLKSVKKHDIAAGLRTVAAKDREAYEAHWKARNEAVERFEAYLKAQSQAIHRRDQQIAHPECDPIIDPMYHKTPRGLIEIAYEMTVPEVGEPVDRDAVLDAAWTLIRNPKRLQHE